MGRLPGAAQPDRRHGPSRGDAGHQAWNQRAQGGDAGKRASQGEMAHTESSKHPGRTIQTCRQFLATSVGWPSTHLSPASERAWLCGVWALKAERAQAGDQGLHRPIPALSPSGGQGLIPGPPGRWRVKQVVDAGLAERPGCSSKPSLESHAHSRRTSSSTIEDSGASVASNRHGFRRQRIRRHRLRCHRCGDPVSSRGWTGGKVHSQGRGTQAREVGDSATTAAARSEDEGRKWLPCRRAPQPTQRTTSSIKASRYGGLILRCSPPTGAPRSLRLITAWQ